MILARLIRVSRAQHAQKCLYVGVTTVYQAFERHLAKTEEPYDVEAGLVKLKDWISAEQPRV
jgi:hypothetical protein